MTLRLPADRRDRILAHAHEDRPEEVVGVLAGERGDVSTVERVHRAENAAARRETRYEIAPHELVGLLERVDDAGLDVVGFYHSHPRGPTTPSETDAEAAAWPGHSYLVVSPTDDPPLGCWRWTGEAFEREAVVVP